MDQMRQTKTKNSHHEVTYVTSSPIKLITAGVLFAALMGCSVTSLQCGTDGDSSFVNLNTTPQVLSQQSRNMAELCSFSLEYEEKS